MKKFASILLLVGIVALNGCGTNYSSEIKAYDFDTAIIQYELNGATTGDETLYIRGDEMALYRFIARGEQEESKLELYLGEKMYIANMSKLTAVESENMDYIAMKDLSKEEQESYLINKALGLDVEAATPESTLTKEVAGQTCSVYEVSNIGEVCLWNGIVLEKTISMAGVTDTKVATSIQIDTTIDGEKMQLPSNIVVKN